ncbi:hypothetical protein IM40_03280 [Candidatus Paracaedimonas acanthamoebae]|nr:hypothetical protein IM40_03280 [Candidatus Paracaedimonas acanthamoebae]
MKKMFSFLLASLFLGTFILYLHWQGGLVAISWRDYQLETTVGILFLMLVISLSIFKILTQILYFTFNWRKYNQARHRKKIPEVILTILTSLERGLPKIALEKAKFIQKYSPTAGLGEYFETLALIALNDDEQAKIIFKIMTTFKGVEYLGWQGLARLSLKNDRPAQAQAYAEKALQYFPNSPYALKMIHEQAQALGDYKKAEHALGQLKKIGYFEEDLLREKKGALLAGWAKSLDSQQSHKEALSRAKKAYRIHPGVEEGKILAELHVKLNHRWRAQFLIKRLWKLSPDQELCQLYIQAINPETPLKAYEAIQKLTAQNQEHEISLIVLAEAAHKARLWGATEEYLHQLAKVTKDPTTVNTLEKKLSGYNALN